MVNIWRFITALLSGAAGASILWGIILGATVGGHDYKFEDLGTGFWCSSTSACTGVFLIIFILVHLGWESYQEQYDRLKRLPDIKK